MPIRVPQTFDQHYPGVPGQVVLGLANLGYCAIDATLSVNTVQTDAQIIAAPPNVTAVPSPAVVHSLGTAPTAAIVQMMSKNAAPTSGMAFAIEYQYLTANNSAVFIRAMCWTGAAPAGVAARVHVFR